MIERHIGSCRLYIKPTDIKSEVVPNLIRFLSSDNYLRYVSETKILELKSEVYTTEFLSDVDYGELGFLNLKCGHINLRIRNGFFKPSSILNTKDFKYWAKQNGIWWLYQQQISGNKEDDESCYLYTDLETILKQYKRSRANALKRAQQFTLWLGDLLDG